MKKIVIILLLSNYAFSQEKIEVSVEKSIYGIQTGFLGLWINNESKLSNQISIKTELGFDAGIFGGDIYPKTGFLMTPVVLFEPRWYYNLDKRQANSKIIKNNNGNFLTMQARYNPNWFVISNYDNVDIVNQLSIIPTWGLKRNIGSHFNYETGIGLGVRYYFAKSEGYEKNESEAALNLHFRFGYTF